VAAGRGRADDRGGRIVGRRRTGAGDVIFTAFWRLTNQLVQSLGYPLDPSMGFRLGFDNAAVGIGDLLVYGLYVNAALKAYGRRRCGSRSAWW
jgi:hypothetical protein